MAFSKKEWKNQNETGANESNSVLNNTTMNDLENRIENAFGDIDVLEELGTMTATTSKWVFIGNPKNKKNIIIVVESANHSNVYNIPRAVISKYTPANPLRIIDNGTTIFILANAANGINIYDWGHNYNYKVYGY